MRSALGGLTTRGRSFVAAGVAAIACAIALGEEDLIRVGALLIALPLVAVVFVVRARYRLACRRRVEPARAPAGRDVRVGLRLESVSRAPTGLLLLEDHVPYVLGGSPRFVIDRIEPRGARELGYRLRTEVRGKFRLGPLSVRLADPLGLTELSRSFAGTDTLIVTPAIVALPRTRFVGDFAGSGDSRTRTLAAAGEDDVSPREYRRGDDIRRVHWRSTARHGELMVRREEQHWHSRGVVLLDTRRIAHRGQGPASTFEWAVSAAASVGVHLARNGFALRLLTDAGGVAEGVGARAGHGGAFEGALLDALAFVRPSRHPSLRHGIRALRHEDGGLVVAILGSLGLAEARELAMVQYRGSARIAILMDVTARGTGGGGAETGSADAADEPATVLRTAGWRVVQAGPTSDVAEVWRTADGPAVAVGGQVGVAGGRG